ncbi:MAG: SNF2-related protein, partial [Christensenella sp.]
MKYVPHNYQSYCQDRIIEMPYIGLFLDMGLGKTVITLTAIHDLKYKRFALRRALVIAPKKVAEATWCKEAAKWNHLTALRVSTVLGTAAQREHALSVVADLYVINRDNVKWLV